MCNRSRTLLFCPVNNVYTMLIKNNVKVGLPGAGARGRGLNVNRGMAKLCETMTENPLAGRYGKNV